MRARYDLGFVAESLRLLLEKFNHEEWLAYYIRGLDGFPSNRVPPAVGSLWRLMALRPVVVPHVRAPPRTLQALLHEVADWGRPLELPRLVLSDRVVRHE